MPRTQRKSQDVRQGSDLLRAIPREQALDYVRGVAAGHVAGDRARGADLLVQLTAGLDGPLLGLVIDAIQPEPEARVVALAPLKVIDQGPKIIAHHRHVEVDRAPD